MKLDEDKLNSIGHEGKKNVIRKFNVDQLCQTTLTEYKKLLKK